MRREMKMSVDIYIEGLRGPTDDYRAKLEAYRACVKAKVSPPDDLLNMFGHKRADDQSLDHGTVADISRAIDGRVFYEPGAVINLSKLPVGVTSIRVYAG